MRKKRNAGRFDVCFNCQHWRHWAMNLGECQSGHQMLRRLGCKRILKDYEDACARFEASDEAKQTMRARESAGL